MTSGRSTNGADASSRACGIADCPDAGPRATADALRRDMAAQVRGLQSRHPSACGARSMSRLDELGERIERLALRHEELRRTNVLLDQQLATVSSERDSLKSRLGAARARIDALLDRLPAEPAKDQL